MHRIASEYAYVRKFYEKLWAKPLGQRVRLGRAVEQLTFREINRKRGVVKFHCPNNDSRFRQGDVLRLSRNDPAGDHVEVTWYGEDDDWIGVVFYQKQILQRFLDSKPDDGSWTIDESYVDLQGLYYRAFDELTVSPIGRDQVIPILAGSLTPSVDLAAFDEATASLKDSPMNETQTEAAAMAMAATPYALIQGPPGTGKTRTVAMIVKQLLERGERVLITALTHRAIHQALNASSDLVSTDQLAKIGVPVYDPGLKVSQYPSFTKSPLADSGSAYAIGATPFSLWSRRLQDVEFDTVIFDESSQVTPALAVLAMLKARRYLFVGDHQQLPPVVIAQPSDDELDFGDLPQSIFARLRDHSSSTMLTTCYRMNADLCQWSSEQFYHGDLKADPANASRRLSLPNQTLEAPKALLPEPPSVRIELDHDENRTVSSEEADLVSRLVNAWLAAGVSPKEIGVVVPYRRQANRIRQRLRVSMQAPAKISRAITVDTVERFQGSEREVMILSFTASDARFIANQAAFLFQPQRLNVAATRSRSKRVLLISKTMTQVAEQFAGNGNQDAAVFLSLLQDTSIVDTPTF